MINMNYMCLVKNMHADLRNKLNMLYRPNSDVVKDDVSFASTNVFLSFS